MTRSTGKLGKRRYWTDAELEQLRVRYPHEPTQQLADAIGRRVNTVYAKAGALGLAKTPEYLAGPYACRLRRGDNVGAKYRFKPGQVPVNKGLRRPGWAPGRMKETQFKKGQFPVNRDPGFYVLGALRVNDEGYIEMRTSFDQGMKGWTGLHRVLWEDAHGPIPSTHALVFIDGDRLNVCLENLELITRAELMARNTIHRYPPALKHAIRLARKVERTIHEQEH
jgi:hypothetical protein